MYVFKPLKWVALTVALLMAALALAACGGDDEEGVAETGTGADTVTSAPASAGAGDEIYQPVSDVVSHAAIALDAAEISALFGESPVDYAAMRAIYTGGKNSVKGDGSVRTLQGFATDPERAVEFAAAAAFYGSPTFLDDEIIAAIDGTGFAADWSDGQRKQAVNKGILRTLYHWVLSELNGAEAKLADGNLDPGSGAPHNWDEAWAFYVGAADETGARPYALAATALKREGDFGKEGLIDAPLRQALADGLEAILAGDVAGVTEARATIESRLNAIFYLATARYFGKAYEDAVAGESAAVHLAEGLAFYRPIQPMVAAVDPEADSIIEAFYLRPADSAVTVEERDNALDALNGTAVTTALGIDVTVLLTPASFG